MFQTDTVTLQTKSEVNTLGSIAVTWSDSTTVKVDVQDINKELVFKTYGFSEFGEYKQVFDHNLTTNWVKGNQVKFNNEQWWVKLVNKQMGKLTASNHIFIILQKVV